MSLASRSWSPSPRICIQVILGITISGVGLTAVLLTLYGYAALNPASRRYLDRVSFRLLTYALIAHLCFGIAFAIGTLIPYPGRGCALLSFLGNLTFVFSAGMFFSIAINLPLVLAFNVNGRRMEKYYIIGNLSCAIISNVATYASGNFGWDDVNETCWYHSKDPTVMLHWLIGSQTVWILFASIAEVIAFMVIIGYIVAYRLIPENIPATYSSTASPRPGLTIFRLRNIILRIGLYPLVSCIVNTSITVVQFYLFQNHKEHVETSQPNWKLNFTVLSIYAGRPLIYGLLAATDPSFVRALRALRHPELETQWQDRTPPLEMSTIICLSQDEISITEQDKEATPGSSMQAQIKRDETCTVSIRGTNSEMGKMRSLVDRDGTRASIDLVAHI
ncbi:hypothetical protein MSAN_02023500 [Mycena sanguinolenta]|uniref:Uncharacterized protein n=1 Tax=Mycena sanguinolenta TaxID=230812 RepID=A0A8H6XLG4_9AGAR|nr:hypothetical protein MSAN_02023500 [Mycena sanguinolenta]